MTIHHQNNAALGAELETVVAPIDAQQAELIAIKNYGLSGKATWLWGEKDSNYRYSLDDGRNYLLKILNPAEDPQVTNMHSSALLHVERVDPSIPTQRIIPTVNGEPDFLFRAPDQTMRSVRMVTFVPGQSQRTAPHSVAQRHGVGVWLAKLQIALSNFNHKAAKHKITWDMKYASQMRDLLSAIPEGKKRDRIDCAIKDFDTTVVPIMSQIPSQIIQNDFNMENILVDPNQPDDVTGIIDFGDMVYAPLIFDVAVGAAYQMGNEKDPVAAICDFLTGYTSIKPISMHELTVLYQAILMRCVMRISIPMWRAQLFPSERDRLIQNVQTVWDQIERLDNYSQDEIVTRIIAACRTN